MKERLQKILSAAGVCSRRTAESYLLAGRITVNGKTAQVGDRADPETDTILVDGVPVVARPALLYLMLNKPRGYVTTLSDEQGRPDISSLIRDVPGRVYPVGRLDRDSDGLLLLTNDGELTQRLLHPSHEVTKTYHVTVEGDLDGAGERLAAVRRIGEEDIRPALVGTVGRSGSALTLAVTIHEGKNRQIRRMCAQCGLKVVRLQRVREHTLELGTLPPGKWRFLTEDEIRSLKE